MSASSSPLEQNRVLIETFGPSEGAAKTVKDVALVVAGIAVLVLAAKTKIPMWPVPLTLGTFAVLAIGASYGLRLGLFTIVGYMLLGVLGFDVFASSSAQNSGLAYMMGGTGGYLVGYVLATITLGYLAHSGWDRSVVWMALALLISNILIYVPGLAWLGVLYGWDQPILAWGLYPFLIGDMLKLILAALLLPALWSVVPKGSDT